MWKDDCQKPSKVWPPGCASGQQRAAMSIHRGQRQMKDWEEFKPSMANVVCFRRARRTLIENRGCIVNVASVSGGRRLGLAFYNLRQKGRVN
jgi:hypothetical protein